MATIFPSPQKIHGSLINKSQFFGQNQVSPLPQRFLPSKSLKKTQINAKFDIFELLGGRGLCNGEAKLQEELKKDVQNPSQISAQNQENSLDMPKSEETLPEEGFEKELMGLTGGFPGGEKGLMKFIEENPPPPSSKLEKNDEFSMVSSSKKPKPPELPMLLPGMIALVKNPNNPFYMYCGIVQRITDGKAGVIFEGGNWDRLVTFRLEELERREKGPPMTNRKSVILEPLIEQLEKQESS